MRFQINVSLLDGSSTPVEVGRFGGCLRRLGLEEVAVAHNEATGVITARFVLRTDAGPRERARQLVQTALREARLPARPLMVGAALLRG